MAAPAVRHPGELRWETRLLAVLILTLLVFGIAMVYGAASYQTRGGGLAIATSQLSGALRPYLVGRLEVANERAALP